MARTLIVLLNGSRIGTLDQDPHGRLSFTYDDDYRQGPGTPLSLSMPRAKRTHANTVVEPFLRGLLPDNDNVLRRWGGQHGVPWNSPLAHPRTVGDRAAWDDIASPGQCSLAGAAQARE